MEGCALIPATLSGRTRGDTWIHPAVASNGPQTDTNHVRGLSVRRRMEGHTVLGPIHTRCPGQQICADGRSPAAAGEGKVQRRFKGQESNL